MNKVIRRIFTVLPAVLLQALWLLILFRWLAPWAALINLGLSLLSFLFVLYLITKRDEGTYKILWLLVILTFPLPGAALYLVFGNKRTTKPLRKKLKAVRELPPAGDDTALCEAFQALKNVTGARLYPNRSARYYPLGDELFPAMLEELEKARRFIFVEYFIIENGFMWDSMVEIMSRKAAQGVDVRVLYDDLGSISTYSRQNAAKLKKKGIRCAAFNPLVVIKGTLNYRDHRKMLIIDGETAFSGGVNLADEYINHIQKYGHWKDIGFCLKGEAAQAYTRMFAEFWDAFTGETIPEEILTGKNETKETGNSVFAAQSDFDGLVCSYYDSPLRADAASNELYIDLLSQAREYAWFFTPYLMPGEALTEAFIRAAGRGVDVRIIMPGVPDKKLVFRMSGSFYPVLLEAGVKIYEYEPGFVHAKGCVIDGIVGTVGTVNLDYRSLFLHFENNSLFYKASLLEDLKQDFLDTQEKCREKTMDNIGMNFRRWLLDGILRIFAPLC